ncbi:MAG: glycosyltransferase, partial [Candidatus Helarchaeota archaeon]|nr:glycosyltransferase [Candidatus Helarchaeota archaeon]
MLKISLCIPTYNRAELLKKLLNRLSTFDFDDLEIIIVDNKSTDKTIELFKNNTYNNIKFFQNSKNIGMANNWNRCIELASGDYILIFHSDDLITPELISEYKKIITKYPSVGFIFSYPFKIDASDQIIEKLKVLKGNLIFYPPSFYYLMICANLISAPGVLIKKECYEKIGRFQDFDLIADYDMW